MSASNRLLAVLKPAAKGRTRVSQVASLKRRGKRFLVQFWWDGRQRTKSLGVTDADKAGWCRVEIGKTLRAIRQGRIPWASPGQPSIVAERKDVFGQPM